MKKFILLFALLFLAGLIATLWPEPASAAAAQLTNKDKSELAGKLEGTIDDEGVQKGEEFPKSQTAKPKKPARGNALDDKHGPSVGSKFSPKNKDGKKGKLDHKNEAGKKGNKGLLKGKKGKVNAIDDEVTWGKKGKKGKVNAIDDEITWGKNASKGDKKGFGKVQKRGFHKNEKGFHKNEGAAKGAKGTLKPQGEGDSMIDDEPTWANGDMKNNSLKTGKKGFLKNQGAGAAPNSMPAAK